MKSSTSPEGQFAKLVEDFFLERLIRQRNSSPQTVAAYRDCFRLLFEFVRDHRNKPPDRLMLADLDAPLVLAFLDHLEKDRNNSIRSRNARLAALRSFLHFAAFKHPESLALIHRTFSIPMKRCVGLWWGLCRARKCRRLSAHRIIYVGRATRSGSLGDSVQHGSARLGGDQHQSCRCHSGRQPQYSSSWQRSQGSVGSHLAGHCDSDSALVARIDAASGRPLFPAASGGPLTRSAVTDRLKRATKTASIKCASLAGRKISPHTFRHATAMHLLQSGVDIALIALWLGHESPTTTHIYIEADLKMKEAALKVIKPPALKGVRYQPPKGLLGFLQSL